ncbi:adenylate kinase [Mycobacterium conspicuum]|uniref:Topology modulation protein n=1 Tax=Mycobacterium conspicuum TaxID=44010 RepID=A0A7I7YJB7_9MYCO|nr:adenylate kinase [Mycobacterium conspicuum]BBZ41437.1 topology modulation protein [Mycobacterium conspicuum]
MKLEGSMQRVVILGRGGAGKSVLAQQLSVRLRIPVIELDSLFWLPGPRPTAEQDWTEIQRRLVAGERWIIDGDLGPYDTGLALRLRAADTIVVLDFPLCRCVWRTLRRSRETREYWAWVCRYRRDSLPVIRAAIARSACDAAVHILHNPRQVRLLFDV